MKEKAPLVVGWHADDRLPPLPWTGVLLPLRGLGTLTLAVFGLYALLLAITPWSSLPLSFMAVSAVAMGTLDALLLRRLMRMVPLDRIVVSDERGPVWFSEGLTAGNAVTFMHGPHTLRMATDEVDRGGGACLVELALDLATVPRPGPTLEVASPWWADADRRQVALDGARDLSLAEAGLDRLYRITALDPDEAERVVGPRVEAGLRRLDRVPGESGGYVAMTPDWVCVRKICAAASEEVLSGFLAAATGVLDGVLESLEAEGLPRPFRPRTRRRRLTAAPVPTPPTAEEMTLLPSDGAPADDVFCAVCGVEVGAEGIPCDACGTPQHEDCWAYNGGCATYSCRGTRRDRGAAP